MKIENIHVYAPDACEIHGEIDLPASKSIANRALIIQALSQEKITIENLSKADDTQILQSLLRNKSLRKNVGMAGTAFRFLTAYLAVNDKATYILTGEDRMKNRPIYPLVNALHSLGAEIDYIEKEGFPPLQIKGNLLKGGEVKIAANISSQFISALMMIAPCFEQGLTIHLEGKISSRPYIIMTQRLMQHFGADIIFEENIVRISSQSYKKETLVVESDWSSASYYYSMLAIADEGEIKLKGLFFDSWQGDSVVADIYYRLGICTEKQGEYILLSKTENVIDYLEYDFSDCPDLAQTVIVTCVALGVSGEFTGLESLRIKETDRIAALQNEIGKLGWLLQENSESWVLKRKESFLVNHPIFINTYNDHRMAMAFAPLSLVYSSGLKIENPKVVSKSNPDFWEHIELLGFSYT